MGLTATGRLSWRKRHFDKPSNYWRRREVLMRRREVMMRRREVLLRRREVMMRRREVLLRRRSTMLCFLARAREGRVGARTTATARTRTRTRTTARLLKGKGARVGQRAVLELPMGFGVRVVRELLLGIWSTTSPQGVL
jgi:hypothetical protein